MISLFTIPGAAGFSAAAFLGRLPSGMIALAVVLPISQLTGSYAMAGIVAAATMLGMAIGAPFSGKWVDRYGQCKILLIFALLNFIWTTALVMCTHFRVPLGILCLVGFATGASRLSTGTIARVRWAYVTKTLDPGRCKDALKTAYAFESIIDEIVFISAPVLATLLCTAVHPLAGLVLCMLCFVIGAIALGVQRKTEPMIIPSREKHFSALSIPGLQVVLVAVLFIGISAGAVEVIVVARADNLGLRSLAGLLLATLAFSSILSGFWYGTRSFKLATHLLWIRCLGLLVLALVPLIFSVNLALLALTLFIAGLAIAPTSIAGQVLTERILPSKQLNEGMSMTVTAMVLGMAAGSWLSGILIDKLGAYYAGMFPAMATLMAFIAAMSCAHILDENV